MDKKLKNSGYAIAEIVVYIFILALISLLIVSSLVNISSSSASMAVKRNVYISAERVLSRIENETKKAFEIVDGESVFDASPGRLTLVYKDSEGNSHYARIYGLNNSVYIETDRPGERLVLDSVNVSSLVFRKITTSQSQAVRAEIAMGSSARGYTENQIFYATAVLRGSYKN